MKQLKQDPWKNITKKYKKGDVLKGEITGKAEFGIFVEIEDGVEGLIHISELADVKPDDVYNVGDSIECTVLNVDEMNRKISLGLKLLAKQKERMIIKEYIKTGEESVSSIGELIKLKNNK